MEWGAFVVTWLSGLTSGIVLWPLLANAQRRHRERAAEQKDLSAIVYSGFDAAGGYRPGLLEQLRKIENKVDALSEKKGGA